MAEVEYAPVGPWWTLDGPSLRLPTPHGTYVSLWMTGSGPPVALLPDRGRSADWWLPVVPALGAHVTVAALDHVTEIGEAELVAAVRGVGARLLVTDGEAGGLALAARRAGVLTLPLLLHGWCAAELAGRGVVTVGPPGEPLDAHAADLVAATLAAVGR